MQNNIGEKRSFQKWRETMKCTASWLLERKCTCLSAAGERRSTTLLNQLERLRTVIASTDSQPKQ